MMFNWFLIFGACVELVTANPLTQSIQPCPITTYQTNAYQQPYSDAYVLQPSNTNPYSQQVTIQSPLSYQPLLLSSLKDQIYQIYWNNVLSSPTLKSFFDENSAIYNQNVKETQKLQIDPFNPYNTGGIVNNYIILPPEYLKINETVQARRDELIKSNAKPRRKKRLNKNDHLLKGVITNTGPRRKEKQNINTHKGSGGIKCYTPAEVLDDRIKIPDKKDLKCKNSKRSDIIKPEMKENIPKNKKGNRRSKSKKTKKKKVKKKSMKSNRTECQKNIGQNVGSKTKTRKKHLKRGSDDCECKKIIDTEPLDDETNKANPQKCEEDIYDILNLNQECTNSENRQTRNSKSDAAVIDFRKIFPDLPDDISKSFTWYMRDFYSNPHLTSSNLFPATNMYPYDFTQIYQIPKYSTDVTNKRKDAYGSNKRKKKPKKKKKKQSTKKKSEQVLNNTDGNATTKRTKSKSKQLKELESTTLPSTITDELTSTVEITTIETTTPISIENDTSKEVFHIPNEEYISLEEDVESSEESFPNSEAKQSIDSFRANEKMILANNPKMEAIERKEVYEVQIPEIIDTDNTTNNKSNFLDNNEMEYNESPSTDLLYYDEFQELGLEYEVPNAFDNRLMQDYYPDFTGDNFKYLSREEIDLQNVHNRYFYKTDKNTNSNERFQLPNQPQTYTENQLSNYDSSKLEKMTDDVDKRYFEDKSEEIVFRSPPGLDFPGFVTRKINRERQDSNEICYQHNNGDDFDRFYYDSFADKSEQTYNTDKYMKSNDKSGSMVETVYARSKVVKYGQSQNHQPSKHRTSKHFSSIEERFENDEGKMVIIAKSLRPEDNW